MKQKQELKNIINLSFARKESGFKNRKKSFSVSKTFSSSLIHENREKARSFFFGEKQQFVKK